jgi:hypothetical protein
MDMLLQVFANALEPLRALMVRVGDLIPMVIGALMLLVIGSWLGVWLRYPVDYLFKLARIDDHARTLGLSTVLYRLGLGPSLTHLVKTLVTAIVFLAFFVGAMDTMHLPMIGDFLRRLVGFAPTLMGTMIILGGGLYLGEMLGALVCRAADANHIRGSEGLMRVTHGLVVIFAGIIAMNNLGIDIIMIVNNSMTIIVAALGLSFAIAFGVAFGMAGRDSAERFIRTLTPSSKAPAPRMKVAR